MFRILILDPQNNRKDEAFYSLQETLEKQGYTIEAVPSCDSLLRKIQSAPPDLVLVESDECGKDGYSACESLKHNPETENIPVIFLKKEEPRNGEVIQGLKSGASDFIYSYSGNNGRMEEILARIQNTLRTSQTLTKTKALADQLNQMNTELYERNLQVEKELYVARQLQQSLLPPILKEASQAAGSNEGKTQELDPQSNLYSKCHFQDERLKISGIYLPCDALGGDIYDVIQFPSNTLGVAVADVSGHGVPAAFITAIFKSSFYRITHSHSRPGDILFHLNNDLADIVKTGEYVTAVYMQLSEDRRTLEYSGAGHPYPLYYKASEKQLVRLQENGTPLVWFKGMEYPTGSVQLEPGDKLLVFTDGITEMRNIHGEMFSEETLEKMFLELIQESPEDILNTLIQRLSDFTEGHPLEDDVSAVLLEAS